ncbi:hypothetical protein HDU85_002715 [Gaertneriomyces sp. JEL0708]|nr:hypothetical protein HDU85_002715 [Gaertneriomyces sp. JEL0708]
MLLSPFILADPVARKKLTKAAAPEPPPSPSINAPTTPERPPFRTLPISSPLSRSTSRVCLQYEGLPSAGKERKQTFLGLLRGKLSIDKSSSKGIKDVERTKPLFGTLPRVSGSDEDEKQEAAFKPRPGMLLEDMCCMLSWANRGLVGGLASSVSVHNLRQLFERSNEAPGIDVSLKPPRAKNLLSRDVLNRSDATLVETPVDPDVPDIDAQVNQTEDLREDVEAHHAIDAVACDQAESQEITTPDSLAIATVPDDTTQASDEEKKQSAQQMLAFAGQQVQPPSGQTHACDMIGNA